MAISGQKRAAVQVPLVSVLEEWLRNGKLLEVVNSLWAERASLARVYLYPCRLHEGQ
jgi:hypothetical protein